MSVANISELRMAIGYKKQAALQTALVAADCWSLNQNNRAIGQAQLITENNANDLGKGDEFASQVFKTYWDSQFPWEYFLTSENAAMVCAFGLGKATKAAAGTGFKYTCVPLDPLTEGLEMPSTTGVQAIRQGATPVVDFGLIGLCCEEFTFSLKNGPGRENATMRSSWVGCGKHASPSTITIPTITAEHSLNAGGAAITILGVNYVTTQRFISCDFGWKNNILLNSGFYPGSGSQDGAQIRGRMRHGARQAMLSFVAELPSGSSELDALLALTEGTAVIEVTGAEIGAGPATHGLKATYHRLAFTAAPIGESDGIVTVSVSTAPMKHTTNGVVTMEVTCEQDNILAAAA